MREQLAKRIRNAEDLWDLREAMVAFENVVAGDLEGTRYERLCDTELNANGVDLYELPTFGGTEPHPVHGGSRIPEDGPAHAAGG
jgi:hypothetical protein